MYNVLYHTLLYDNIFNVVGFWYSGTRHLRLLPIAHQVCRPTQIHLAKEPYQCSGGIVHLDS
jgi:hypothetical protein